MRKFWLYGVTVVLLSTMLSWCNMGGGGSRGYSSAGHGSSWSSSTGGGSWSGGGGGHK